jgi:hypothetical protein
MDEAVLKAIRTPDSLIACPGFRKLQISVLRTCYVYSSLYKINKAIPVTGLGSL